MEAFLAFMRANGTKIIGYVLSVAATISLMDKTLVMNLFGERGYSWILLLAGLGVVARGHTNTAAIKADLRVEEKAKEKIKVDDKIDELKAKGGKK